MSIASQAPRTIAEKVVRLNWGVITLLCALAFIGVLMHFSVSSGVWDDMPLTHAMRFAALLLIMMLAAVFLDTRFWQTIAYPLYLVSFLALVAVEVIGQTRMGATRWLSLGPLSLQPSELMKVAVVLALARYYQQIDPRKTGTVLWSVPPLIMIALPAALVMKQPDLGTAMLIAITGIVIMFLGGLAWRIIGVGVAAAIGGALVLYKHLHGYQKARIDTFLGLQDDPLGTGYHVLQSKIAVGSAGLFGRGWMHGSQAQLDFLPEKHTDFIFTMIVEEFGLVGGLFVLALYGALMALALRIALRSRSSRFGRLAAGGVAAMLASYVFINTAMVIGLAPVVGIPLPMISFGGTAMTTLMVGFAIVLSVDLHPSQQGARGLLL
ncbi:MAG TPA: rod shape-determining protein RodA [Caulobacterales bacterium]|nr:rod shape-determining protein RodA [Caulobacterales bacterium]